MKGNYQFAEEVYDLYIKQTSSQTVGFQPQKTSIGIQVSMRDIEIIQNEYESKLGQWATEFQRIMNSICKSKVKYFELRPYSYAPI